MRGDVNDSEAEWLQLVSRWRWRDRTWLQQVPVSTILVHVLEQPSARIGGATREDEGRRGHVNNAVLRNFILKKIKIFFYFLNYQLENQCSQFVPVKTR